MMILNLYSGSPDYRHDLSGTEAGPSLIVGSFMMSDCSTKAWITSALGGKSYRYAMRRGFLHYGGMWYADWSLCPVTEYNLPDAVPLDPFKLKVKGESDE